MNSFVKEARQFIKQLTNCSETQSSIGCDLLTDYDSKKAFHLVELSKAGNSGRNGILNITNYFLDQGIQIVNIREDVWQTKRSIVESRISAMYGTVKRIHARETHPVDITQSVSDDFFNANHLMGSAAAKYGYGLVFKDEIVAVASFAAFRIFKKPDKNIRSTELIRFANLNGRRVVGGLSKLIDRFVKQRKPDDIMSYVDRDWSAGAGYRLLGFEIESITEPQMFMVDPRSYECYSLNKLPYPRGESDDTIIRMQNEGFVKIYNSGNIKYKKYLNNPILP